MGIRLLLILSLSFVLETVLAQDTKRVRAEYTYHASEEVTMVQAKKIALERAKLQAIADEFGTVVSQTNTTVLSAKNGASSQAFFSLSGSEVKGEWIETIGEPEYEISYEQDMLVVKATVEGRIREIIAAQIDFDAEVLCNGTELKFANTDFKSGDDLYLYFKSPVDGYLTVYLLEELTQMTYCLLPYKNSSEAVTSVKGGESYIFFSAKCAGDNNPDLVDEYEMTSSATIERCIIYAIFSPNEYVKANSDDVKELLPRELSFEEFQKWLAKNRTRDIKMGVKTIPITITSKK